MPEVQKQPEVVTDGPSDDFTPAQAPKPKITNKITNREANDAPEVAFKTYRASNTIANTAQVLTPLSESAKTHMSVDAQGASISVPKGETRGTPRLTVTLEGVMELAYPTDAEPVTLRYQLPAYYERSEIQARETEQSFDVRVPLYASPADDVLTIPF